MKDFFYFKGIRKVIVQFLDMFNDMEIAKYSEDGSFLKNIKVPLKFAPKEKAEYFSHKHPDKYLPMIGVALTSIEAARDRNVSFSSGIYRYLGEPGNEAINKILKPVPYNISFSVNIISQYIIESDQIVEQILPYFDPYAVIKIDIPELALNYEAKTLLGNVTWEAPVQLQENNYRTINCKMDFRVQAFLFKPAISAKEIHKVITNYYLDKKNFDQLDTTSPFLSGEGKAEIETRLLGWRDADNSIITRLEVFE